MNALALVALILAIAEPQSPPPSPTPTATSQNQQDIRRAENPQPTESNTVTENAFSLVNQATPKPTTQASETASGKDRKKSSFDYTALTVAIFTGLLAWVAWLQLQATNRQVAHTILDQRAWVGLFSIDFNPPTVGQIFKVKIVAKNTGKTFARKVMFSCMSRMVQEGEIPDFASIVEDGEREYASDRSVGLITPGGISQGGATGTNPVAKEEVDRFLAGELHLYVFGRISYEDIFDCPHWTTFCWDMDSSCQQSAFREYNEADTNRARG